MQNWGPKLKEEHHGATETYQHIHTYLAQLPYQYPARRYICKIDSYTTLTQNIIRVRSWTGLKF